eukprot:2303682-Rhodomonas_salina.1
MGNGRATRENGGLKYKCWLKMVPHRRHIHHSKRCARACAQVIRRNVCRHAYYQRRWFMVVHLSLHAYFRHRAATYRRAMERPAAQRKQRTQSTKKMTSMSLACFRGNLVLPCSSRPHIYSPLPGTDEDFAAPVTASVPSSTTSEGRSPTTVVPLRRSLNAPQGSFVGKLRFRYTLSGTDIGYVAISCSIRTHAIRSLPQFSPRSASCLRPPYAMSGPDIPLALQQSPMVKSRWGQVASPLPAIVLRFCYAIYGTDVGCHATIPGTRQYGTDVALLVPGGVVRGAGGRAQEGGAGGRCHAPEPGLDPGP